MKASYLILAAAAALTLSGCGHDGGTKYVDVRTPSEKAQECVAAFEPNGKAPQVMTYDSSTQTEVHMNQQGRDVNVTAQNPTDNTAMAMGGTVGGDIPDACTDADPRPLPAETKHHMWWDSSSGSKH